MVQDNQAEGRRDKTGHLLEWAKAIAPYIIVVTVILGILTFSLEREKEHAVRFLNTVALLDKKKSEAVRVGAVSSMGAYYGKYHDRASQVLACHLAVEASPLVRVAILNVLKQAGSEATTPLAAMNRVLAKRDACDVYSMNKFLEEYRSGSLVAFIEKSLSGNLSDIATALATVLKKGSYPEGREPDLSEVCLSSWSSERPIMLDLEQANLEEADLTRACLIAVSLRKANLKGAYLYGALLYNVDLTGASLQGAKWSGCRLVEVICEGANLTKADLTEAVLHGANMEGANLYGADLRRTDLYWTNLTKADLREAVLEGANMEGANLYGADLRGTDLQSADLTNANLARANMKEAVLDLAVLDGANLVEATFDPTDIKRAKNWENAIFDDSTRQKLGLTNINQYGSRG